MTISNSVLYTVVTGLEKQRHLLCYTQKQDWFQPFTLTLSLDFCG
jgi:hypothetical protein